MSFDPRYNNVLESYLLKTGDILASTVVAEYDPDDVSGNSRPSRRLPPRSSAFRNSSTGLLHFVIQPHAPVRRNQSRNRLVYLPPAFKKCIKHLQAALSGAAGSKNITFDDALDTYQRLYDEPPLEDNPLFHEACTRIRFSEQGFHRIIVYVSVRSVVLRLSVGHVLSGAESSIWRSYGLQAAFLTRGQVLLPQRGCDDTSYA